MPSANNKKPLGVYIFSSLNIFLFGLVSLAAAIAFVAAPSIAEKVVAAAVAPAAPLSLNQIKILGAVQIAVSVIYVFCGIGLLLGKEPVRQITVYFSFALLILVLISALAQPAMIGQSLFNALYPLALIIYFTDRRVERWFKKNDCS